MNVLIGLDTTTGKFHEVQVNSDGSLQVVAGGSSALIEITLSLDTNPYAVGDVLADTQALAGALRKNGGTGYLVGVVLNDKDDQGAALDLYILRSNVSLGTENAAPSITDANADEILSVVSILSSDWKDLGGCRVAEVALTPRLVKSASDSTSVFAAFVTQGTPTHTAAGMTAKFKFVRD